MSRFGDRVVFFSRGNDPGGCRQVGWQPKFIHTSPFLIGRRCSFDGSGLKVPNFVKRVGVSYN